MSEAWRQWEGHVVNESFYLKKCLGGSEASAVFLAEDRGAEPKPVAIKLVAADPATAERRLSRWALSQKLSHPHLLRILQTGRCKLGEKDLIFAVMEYAEENLAEILCERALTPQEAGEMLKPTLDALAYIHSQGFVHGHLKPANILAVHDQLKLSTDGITGAGKSDDTQDNLSIYDPPEASRGVKSRASDIWSLGMTLVEVLTRRVPSWSANDQADPVLPDSLSEPFLDIVRGCLRRDPQRRSIAVTTAQFHLGPPKEPVSRDEKRDLPEPSTMVRSSGRPGSWLWRSAFPLVLGVVGLAVLVAGFGYLHRQPESQLQSPAAQPEQSPTPPKPDAGKPSPGTGQQQGATGGLRATTAPMASQPASLRSETRMQSPIGESDGSGVVHQVLPEVPQAALDTIQGTIRVGVKVNVDPAGNVAAADLDSPGPSKYFARLSLQAAHSWKFVPSGQSGGRDFVVYFEFRNDGSKAYARPGA
jgi:TonB family protein